MLSLQEDEQKDEMINTMIPKINKFQIDPLKHPKSNWDHTHKNINEEIEISLGINFVFK